MNIHTQSFAIHATWINDAVGAINRIACRDAVDQVTISRVELTARMLHYPPYIGVADFMPGNGKLHFNLRGPRTAASHIDENPVDAFICHLLSRINSRSHGSLNGIHVDHLAVTHAVGAMMTDARDLQLAAVICGCNETTDFRCSYIKGSNDAVA